MPYVAEKVALHLVDKKHKILKRSKAAQSVAGLKEEVKKFLNEHVEMICSADEERSVWSAHFRKGSRVQGWYNDLTKEPEGDEKPADFLKVSRALAKRLYEVSPDRASPGLLMVLLFRLDDSEFLGLFKLDPFDEYMIELDDSNKDLFDFSVQDVEQALPRADSRRVLKCAVIRHPTRDDYDLKFRDKQNAREPAKYFREFLECPEWSSDRSQMQHVADIAKEYVEKKLKEKKLEPSELSRTVPALVERLEERKELVTADTVVETAREMGIVERKSDENELKDVMSKRLLDIHISGERVNFTRMAYQLPNDIVIKGPIADMKNLVHFSSLNGGFEFKVSCPGPFKVVYD